MKSIIFYLCVWLIGIVSLVIIELRDLLPIWISGHALMLNCSLIGALGGIIYCLRSVYLNKCVKGIWDENWTTWYYIRPIVSMLMGSIAYLFIKAGLFVLETNSNQAENPYGFLCLSFIAGLNVDNFQKKIEELAKTTWGVIPSRTSSRNEHE